MSQDRLQELDGPLLVALATLLETASVTATSRILGRTQSSMSRTLARLRDVFEDPLLVPVGRAMRLTQRGAQLRTPVAQALDGMRRLFVTGASGSPRDEHRTVRLAAVDYTTIVLLNGWIARLRRTAPGISVRVTPVDADSIDPLTRGEIDLALAPLLPGVGLDRFVARKIFVDDYVCVLRRGHPLARRRLTLARYLALEHIMVASVLPAVSSIDEALRRRGVARVIAARLPSVPSALHLAAISDLAATSYARLVPLVGPRVVVKRLPFVVAPLELHLLWPPQVNRDPFHRWLREDLLAYARGAARA